MIKFLKYLTQSIIIYSLFIFGKIIGLKKSQNVFSKIFQIIGPNFRSRKTINQNLEKFDSNISESKKKRNNSSNVVELRKNIYRVYFFK